MLRMYQPLKSNNTSSMKKIRNATRRSALAAAICALAAFAIDAAAQVQRPFPATALRGALVVGQTPEITLNGRNARLAPGARIRGQNNMIELPAMLMGQHLMAHYTIDFNGDVGDVWILTPDEEANRPWPTTPEEAARWEFDPAAQTWTRR